jgi:hypothetical protein
MAPYQHHQKASLPDHIYYDLTLRNFQSTSVESTQLRFNESRSIPYVPDASQYHLSIVRFTCDTFGLPVFLADIQPNQANPNLMIHSITLEYDDGVAPPSVFQQFLSWVSDRPYVPVPPPPSANADGLQTVATDYYYSNSYEHVIDIINTAFSQAMAGLIALVPALAGTPAPFLDWDNNISTLYAVNSLFNSKNLPASPQINIYFNRPMFAMLNSFPAFRNSISTPQGRVYRILMFSGNGTNLTTNANIFGGALALAIKQAYSVIANWQPVMQIVFTSNTLPIYPNMLSTPQILANGQIISRESNDAAFAQIISDLSSFDQSMRPLVVYTPTAEYRRIDLLDVKQPLTNLDVSVYWRDKNGRLNEFLFLSGACASIKFLFERRKNDD